MAAIRGIVKKYLRKGATNTDSSFLNIEYEPPNGGPLVVGKLSSKTPQFEEGDSFVAEGFWKENTFKGESQPIFVAKLIRPEFPISPEGAFSYLMNTFTYAEHGIVPDKMRFVINQMGDNAIKQIVENPERLVGISNKPDVYRDRILKDLGRKTSNWKAVELMESVKINETVIKRVLEVYRNETLSILENDPYQILTISNIDFVDADKIARKIGIATDDYRRLNAAMYFCLKQESLSGSTAFPATLAVEKISESINIDRKVVQEFLLQMIKNNDHSNFIVTISPKTKLPVASLIEHYRNEIKAADNLCRLMKNGKKISPSQVKTYADIVMKGKPFDEYQRKAVEIASIEPVSIITGGPGTGKSTIFNSIIEISRKLGNNNICVVAPTGKAAKRAEETTGVKATTVQMLLGMQENPQKGFNTYKMNKDNKLSENIVVIVDEVSMMDTELFSALLESMPSSGKLVLQGDKDQLPSVGAGKVLADLLEITIDNKKLLPIAELINVYRQDKNSKIATDSKKINSGEIPFIDSSVRGGVTIQECSSENIGKEVEGIFKNAILKMNKIDPIKDVAIIAPQSTGFGGTWELNRILSKLLNKDRKPIPGIEKQKFDDERMPIPHVGDKVMLTENIHEHGVMNGDVGMITGFKWSDDKNPYKTEINVDFECGKKVSFPVSKWRNLILAYAITCHKSQGSQYPLVILPWSKMHKNMSERTLLYTAWTRAKDLVIGVGEREIFEHSINTHRVNQRNTNLGERIKEFAEKYSITPAGDEVVEEIKQVANTNFKPISTTKGRSLLKPITTSIKKKEQNPVTISEKEKPIKKSGNLLNLPKLNLTPKPSSSGGFGI